MYVFKLSPYLGEEEKRLMIKKFVLFCLISCWGHWAFAQLHLPFNHQYYQAYEQALHQQDNSHTAIKPFLSKIDTNTYPRLEELGLKKRLMSSDLLRVSKPDFYLVLNPLFHFELGKEDISSTYVNTRGVELKGMIGKKLSYYTSFYENQAIFPKYVEDHIWSNELIVPGQGESKENHSSRDFDFAMSNGHVSYQSTEHINFQFGHGKHFIGNGYRSMLLSDNSFNYPYLKVTTEVWKLKYVNLFSSYQDVRDEFSLADVHRKKFSTIHYLSWNLHPKWNVGLFEAIVWEQDTFGRGFDVNYLNPIIFYRPIEFSLGSRGGNALMGLSLKYKASSTAMMYGQFIIDEFKIDEVKAGNGWWANKYAAQLGAKYFDAFGIENLFLQTEMNVARPFMYSHHRPLQSYTHYHQSLAHPLGASFIESVCIVRYQHNQWYLNAKYNYALVGGDVPGDEVNYGADVLSSYSDGERMEYGNEIAQGNTADLHMLDFRLGYLLNPKTNMKIELGVLDRSFSSLYLPEEQTRHFFLSLKTDLRNHYYDF